MWGQVSVSFLTLYDAGIIPTRVGTRARTIKSLPNVWDHPHACGDKSFGFCGFQPGIGSSPRVWGQVSFGVRKNRFMRIIPTRVGTSRCKQRQGLKQGDHPHACGDKNATNPVRNRKVGSSPRVWGQVLQSFRKAEFPGIIPTRVGTRPVSLLIVGFIKDHPHACGDKLGTWNVLFS